MNTERGIALILAILVTSFLSAIGLGLALLVFMDRLATGNLRGSVAMLHAADAALELTVRELSQLEDWNAALAGEARSAIADGSPSGVRPIAGGGVVDLTAIGNQLSCGRSSACTDGQIMASTRERPWGENNARWKLFAYGPVGNFVQFARPVAGYLTVWLADDGREADADAGRDGAEDAAGHGVIRVRVEAFGPFGTRRAIEAELARLCIDAAEPCGRGIRVQSWNELRQSIP
jgi:hypothetical protein